MSVWDEKPDPNKFFITVKNWDWDQRFDVSAYLNARDEWEEKLKKAWHQKHLKAHAWVRSKEEYFDNKEKLKTIKNIITKFDNYEAGGEMWDAPYYCEWLETIQEILQSSTGSANK